MHDTQARASGTATSSPMPARARLVQRHYEGRPASLQQVNALHCLLLQAMHEIDDQNGDIAQVGAARPQVGEGLMPCAARSAEAICTAGRHAELE